MFDPLATIQITCQYSNALLVAIMPFVSDFAKRLELPISIPVTTNQVQVFAPSTAPQYEGGSLLLTNGYAFMFAYGHVHGFQIPDNLYVQKNPKAHYRKGKEVLDEGQAIELARKAIRQLGYSQEMLYADLMPVVKPSRQLPGNFVPHYEIEWLKPNMDGPSLRMEINAFEKRVTQIHFHNYNLWKENPEIGIQPIIVHNERTNDGWTALKSDDVKSQQMIKKIIPQISEYVEVLNLPFELPLTTNQVKEMFCEEMGEYARAQLAFTNGYTFWSNKAFVNAFEAPDVFFDPSREVRVKDFTGPWKLSVHQLIRRAREAIEKLGFSPGILQMYKKPEVQKPNMIVKITVPRCRLAWDEVHGGIETSSVDVEMEASTGAIKRLFIAYPRNAPLPEKRNMLLSPVRADESLK